MQTMLLWSTVLAVVASQDASLLLQIGVGQDPEAAHVAPPAPSPLAPAEPAPPAPSALVPEPEPSMHKRQKKHTRHSASLMKGRKFQHTSHRAVEEQKFVSRAGQNLNLDLELQGQPSKEDANNPSWAAGVDAGIAVLIHGGSTFKASQAASWGATSTGTREQQKAASAKLGRERSWEAAKIQGRLKRSQAVARGESESDADNIAKEAMREAWASPEKWREARMKARDAMHDDSDTPDGASQAFQEAVFAEARAEEMKAMPKEETEADVQRLETYNAEAAKEEMETKKVAKHAKNGKKSKHSKHAKTTKEADEEGHEESFSVDGSHEPQVNEKPSEAAVAETQEENTNEEEEEGEEEEDEEEEEEEEENTNEGGQISMAGMTRKERRQAKRERRQQKRRERRERRQSA